MLKTRTTLRPAAPGTRHLARKYGDRLVRVRYRYDELRRVRVKTVELIEAEAVWVPPHPGEWTATPEEIVTIYVEPWERPLAGLLLRSGAWRGPRTGTWHLPYGIVTTLALEHRAEPIPSPHFNRSRNPHPEP